MPLGNPNARAVHLDFRCRQAQPEHGRDLGVGHPVPDPHQEGRPVDLGKPSEELQDRFQLPASLRLRVRKRRRVGEVAAEARFGVTAPKPVEVQVPCYGADAADAESASALADLAEAAAHDRYREAVDHASRATPRD